MIDNIKASVILIRCIYIYTHIMLLGWRYIGVEKCYTHDYGVRLSYYHGVSDVIHSSSGVILHLVAPSKSPSRS
jgi:hypothetical protein